MNFPVFKAIKTATIFGLCAFMAVSCYKEEETIAEVVVVLPNGNPVPNARVRLWGEPTLEDVNTDSLLFDRIEFSGADGVASFDFTDDYKKGQAGFAIMTVEILKEYPDSNAVAEGIINIKEEEVTRKQFTLRSEN